MLGHDPVLAGAGLGVTSTFLVETLEDCLPFLGSTPEIRQRRSATFFHSPIHVRRRLGQGVHDRGEASVVASGRLSPVDHENVGRHLPLHVKTVSVGHKCLAEREIWDVSVRGETWGLDDAEELYVIVNIGTLEVRRGSSLIVRGNVLICLCQHLIVHDVDPGDYQIGILPTPFSMDVGSGPMDGAAGTDGASGSQGRPGRAIDVVGSFLGMSARERVDPAVLCGALGGDGGAGGRGQRGRNGGMCKLAEITLRRVSGDVTIFARAGRGGDGGPGGAGGNGGTGGDGISGTKLITGIIPDGSGGDGGCGGDGGRGGRAGSGGIASNIYVTVPDDAVSRVRRMALDSEPGRPGRGGRGGSAGRGGVGGGSAPAGRDGRPGRSGSSGPPGRARAAPWIFVNEQPPPESTLAASPLPREITEAVTTPEGA